MFQGVSEREEEQGKVRRSKEKQRDDEDIQNYRQWMRKARRSHTAPYGIIFLDTLRRLFLL